MTIEEQNTPEEAAAGSNRALSRSDAVLCWAVRIVSTLGVIVTVWAALATGDMLVHGHPEPSRESCRRFVGGSVG